MRILAEIEIPEGSKKIIVTEQDGGIAIKFAEPNKVFFCGATRMEEEYPLEGDFAILWKHWQPEKAIVAEVENIISDIYFAGTNEEYDCAVKYRDYEQYRTIKNCGREVEIR